MNDFHLNICAAIESKRGIAKDNHIPWEKIKKDFDYYTKLTEQPKCQGKKIIHINGRMTFECTREVGKSCPDVIHIVVSKTLTSCPEHAYCVVNNFHAAVDKSRDIWSDGNVETVFVMGGEWLFQECLQSPLCHRVYVTYVFAEYPSDRFLPKFEDSGHYQKVIDPEINSEVQSDDSGVEIQIIIYERIRDKLCSTK